MDRLSRRAPLISNNFSETTRPIVTKLHMQFQGVAGTEKCSNGPGHKTNMAAANVHVNNY